MLQAPKNIVSLIEPTVVLMGYELVGVVYHEKGKGSLLRLFIDKKSGITVDDCSHVSHQITGVLEVEKPELAQLTLEVSSPGLDRPLFKLVDFERFLGCQVTVLLRNPVEGKRRIAGLIKGVKQQENAVDIETEGHPICLLLNDIEKANLVPEL